LTELINVATTLKTPAMVIRAKADRANDSEMCVRSTSSFVGVPCVSGFGR
jgi:hypothetical protein